MTILMPLKIHTVADKVYKSLRHMTTQDINLLVKDLPDLAHPTVEDQ